MEAKQLLEKISHVVQNGQGILHKIRSGVEEIRDIANISRTEISNLTSRLDRIDQSLHNTHEIPRDLRTFGPESSIFEHIYNPVSRRYSHYTSFFQEFMAITVRRWYSQDVSNAVSDLHPACRRVTTLIQRSPFNTVSCTLLDSIFFF